MSLGFTTPYMSSHNTPSRERDRRDDDRDRRRDRPSQFSDAPRDDSGTTAANTVLMAALLTQARQMAGGGGMQGVSGPSALRKARRLHVSNLPADIGVTKESISAFFNSAMDMAQLVRALRLPPLYFCNNVARCSRQAPASSTCSTLSASALPSWSFARLKKPLPACSSTAYCLVPPPSQSRAPATTSKAAAVLLSTRTRRFCMLLRHLSAAARVGLSRRCCRHCRLSR